MICYTNNPNAHICTFCKCWSFIRGCFSPVIILNYGIMNNMNSFCYSFIDVLIEFINSVIPLHFFYKQLHFLLQHQFNYGSMNFQSESFPRSSRPEAFLSKVFWKYAANLQQNTHAEVWFQIALQRYWNHTSAWVFSCKFAAYFQNTFSLEHVCVAASVFQQLLTKFNSTSGCWIQFLSPDRLIFKWFFFSTWAWVYPACLVFVN